MPRVEIRLLKLLFLGLLFLMFSGSSFLYAQFPGSQGGIPNYGNSSPPTPDSAQVDFNFGIDTIGVSYYYANDPDVFYPLEDTMPKDFHRYRPTRNWEVEYGNLGNIGSAHQPLYYQSPFRRGFEVGYHQFDQYYTLPEKVKFYKIQNPHTKVFYSQGPMQNDAYFKGEFARNFSDGFQIGIEGKVLRQLGVEQQYQNQAVSDEVFAIGLNYDSPKGDYDGYFFFASNVTQQQENGGLVSRAPVDMDFGRSVASDTVFISNGALTRHVHRSVGYRHYFNLQKKDSLGQNIGNRKFVAQHQILFNYSKYKFYDEFNTTTFSDTLYKSLLLDERGLRTFLINNTLKNEFSLATTTANKKIDTVETTIALDRIEVGMEHQIHFLNQEIKRRKINNLFVTGRLSMRLKDKFKLSAYAHLGLLANGGDYRLAGDLFFDIGKAGNFTAKFLSQAYEPYLVQEEFAVSQRWAWDQDRRKVFETNFGAVYQLPILGLKLEGNYRLISNYIYFDTDNLPAQLEETINLVQLSANHLLKFWVLGVQNQAVIQASTKDVIRLPTWYTKHSLFADFRLFRSALEFQIGTDLSINDSYFANYYHPLTGQFQLQNNQEIGTYFLWDVFANFKIQKVRIFVKAENIREWEALPLVGTNREESDFFYQTSRYPQPLFFVRFGFDWRFSN